MGDLVIPNPDFWKSRRVLLTGHTGFKGGWLAAWLNQLGARIYGFSLPPDSSPNLYDCLQIPYADEKLQDLHNQDQIREFVKTVDPEFVFHLAAQPLVRRGYQEPIKTFSTNVMGTANLLQALRTSPSLRAILVVTSDKAYANDLVRNNKAKKFTELDPLGGSDPYSASKSAQEIVTRSFSESYFQARKIPVATARAGNVIGGGDWSKDRLMTDVIQAVQAGQPVQLRYPSSTRPWQHVLEPLAGYLSYMEALANGKTEDVTLNFGPSQSHKVLDLVEIVLSFWPDNAGWKVEASQEVESQTLELDPTQALFTLGWKTHLPLHHAVSMVVDWHKKYEENREITSITIDQICAYQDMIRDT